MRAFPSSSVIEVGPLLTEARGHSRSGFAGYPCRRIGGGAGGHRGFAGRNCRGPCCAHLRHRYPARARGEPEAIAGILQFAEFGLLVAVLAGVALALGTGLAWLVIVQLFEFDWLPDWPRILAVLGGGLVLVLGFALAASLPLLRARPAQALRTL